MYNYTLTTIIFIFALASLSALLTTIAKHIGNHQHRKEEKALPSWAIIDGEYIKFEDR